MLGKVIVRGDIVYLQDDPVIDPGSIERHLAVLGETLRDTGLRRLLVHGASQTDNIDEAAIGWLTSKLAAVLPARTRIAFAHADVNGVAAMAGQVCDLLGEAGIEATSVRSTGEAEAWLRAG